MNIISEDRLLNSCARIEIDNRSRSVIEEILQRNLNWDYIFQKSKTEVTSCLLYNNLLKFRHKAPENILKTLEEIYYLNISRNIRISQDLKAILSSFNQNKLKVISLKGIFLAEYVYGNIALRGTTDIDLLVKKEDLPRVDNLLVNLGYRTPISKELLSPAIKSSYLNSIDYLKTDKKTPTLHIHWHIVNVTLPTYLYTKNIKINRLWENATSVKIDGTETLQLSAHHLIIYLAEHALKHSFDRLIVLSDIDAAIKKYKEQIDWEGLIVEAKELGMERQLFYGLYFTKYFLDTDIPEYALSDLKPKKTGLLEKRFFHNTLNNSRNSKLSYFVYLAMVKGAINKLRFITRTLFPPPCVLALSFNLNRPRVTLKDYLLFLKEQSLHLKNCFFKP